MEGIKSPIFATDNFGTLFPDTILLNYVSFYVVFFHKKAWYTYSVKVKKDTYFFGNSPVKFLGFTGNLTFSDNQKFLSNQWLYQLITRSSSNASAWKVQTYLFKFLKQNFEKLSCFGINNITVPASEKAQRRFPTLT